MRVWFFMKKMWFWFGLDLVSFGRAFIKCSYYGRDLLGVCLKLGWINVKILDGYVEVLNKIWDDESQIEVFLGIDFECVGYFSIE